jgi:hypothetical protein
MTMFASRALWTARRLNKVCQDHGVHLSERGEVVLGGAVVGSFEIAGGALVFHEIDSESPLVDIFDLQQVE